jgi:outer membrane lipoprotein-sorting protein
MKRRMLLLAAALPLAARAAPDLAQAVKERLRQPEWLRGEFQQAKTVPGFAKPLLSRGDFVLARGRGVLWRTTKPFASELRLTRDEIRATQGGQTAMKLDAAREPAVRVINGLMFALLNGDVSGLEQAFRIEGSVSGTGWALQLVPKAGALAQVLRRVELEGDGFVRRIRLLEASGDESLITLSALRDNAPAEPGLFE